MKQKIKKFQKINNVNGPYENAENYRYSPYTPTIIILWVYIYTHRHEKTGNLKMLFLY